jgi:hypothetical protein
MMWRDFVEPNISRQHRQEDNVRDFLRTGDPAHLLNKPWGDVPYPVGDVLVQRLAPPVIQAVMPPSVRRSVPVADRAANAVPPALPDAVRPVALSTWSQANSPGRVEWRSATQPASTLPVLRFRVAGDLGRPDFDAHVWVKSAAGEAAVIPETAPGNTWKTVNVFRPPGEWWLQVSAATGPAWFAFTEPVEVGRWRWATEKMLKHHFIVLAGGLVLLLAGAVPHLRRPTV